MCCLHVSTVSLMYCSSQTQKVTPTHSGVQLLPNFYISELVELAYDKEFGTTQIFSSSQDLTYQTGAPRRRDRSDATARFFGQPESDPRALQGSREALKSRPVTLQRNWTWRCCHLQGFGCSRDPSEPPGGWGTGDGVFAKKQEPGARAPRTSVCLSMCLHSV